MSGDVINAGVKKRIEDLIKTMRITDYTLNIKRGSTKGDNYLGVIYRAKVEGTNENSESVTLNWIVKCAPENETFKKLANVVNCFEREIYMYEVVIPLLKRFQGEKDIAGKFPTTAPFVLSCMELHEESLVLEDMNVLGYIMKDRKQPMDYEHVRLVMQTYGKLHALSYAMKDQRPDVFNVVAKNMKEYFFTCFDREHMLKRQRQHAEKGLSTLDPVVDKQAVISYGKYADKCFDLITEAFKMCETNPYSVFGHGDSWVNNMLFKYGDPEYPKTPSDVCLIDFQLARYGSPAFDLSYFIFACTDKALRDKYYDQLIRTYYYSLCLHLTDLGSDPEKLLPFSALQAELKRYSIVGLYLSQMVVQLMLSEADEVPDLENISEEDLANSFNFTSKNDSHYSARLRDIILDFVEKGYFDFIK